MPIEEITQKRRWMLAIMGGILWALSFPKPGIAGLGWVGPGLLAMAGSGVRPRASFLTGYIGGLAAWLISISWLLHIPFPAGAIAGWLALSAFLALFPATWVWFCNRFSPFSNAPTASFPSWSSRIRWAILSAMAWVALEMIRARFLSGFPWIPLGSSQYRMLPVIQISSMTGVYGVSFLMVFFSLGLASATMGLRRFPNGRWWLADVATPLLLVLALFLWGMNRLGQKPRQERIATIALVQPSIPQALIFDPAEDQHRFDALVELSERAAAAKPDLLVWPEAAMPAWSAANFAAITNLAGSHHLSFILGADEAEAVPGKKDRIYNASFLFGPDGLFRQLYRKQQLVLFGEYVPFVEQLPFLKWLTPIDGSFSAGTRPVTFDMPNVKLKTSVLICFEDVFPHTAREHVRDGIDFLLNITNDGWFGNGSAQWQHAASALFRAVENGVPLVRCTNNGLTCWIDPFGRMEVWSAPDGSVYEAGFAAARVGLSHLAPTFYRLHGDWFGWGCVGVTGLALLAAAGRRRV